jgi:hypothetical protein
LFISFSGIYISDFPQASFTGFTADHVVFNCASVGPSSKTSFSLFISASIPFGRPKETVGAGHRLNDSSSQQLVS